MSAAAPRLSSRHCPKLSSNPRSGCFLHALLCRVVLGFMSKCFKRNFMREDISGLSADILWEDTVRGGSTWSHVLKRGTSLRITDVDGGANVGAVFYNFECPVERYN